MRKSIHSAEHEQLVSLLRQLREEAGLLQVDIARELGVNQSFVSKYENGERRLDLVQLRAVCGVLGVSLTQLVKRWERTLSE